MKILLLTLLVLTSCTVIEETHGANLRQASIENLGSTSTKADVVNALGSPSTKSTYGAETWYYINNDQRRKIIGANEAVSQEVLAITFNEFGTLANVETYDLDDAMQFNNADRTTKTAGHELTVVEQILGNVGRFTPKNADDY